LGQMRKQTRTETTSDGNVIRISRGKLTEIFIKVSQNEKENPAEMFSRLSRIIKAEGAEIVKMDVFGHCSNYDKSVEFLKSAAGELSWPITWVQGGGYGLAIEGVQVYAIKGGEIETIKLDGRIVGRTFQDDCARYCLLGDMRPRKPSAGREEQTREIFESIEASLRLANMSISSVVRTWFYNDHISEWYGLFNEIRTGFFKERGVFNGVVPASTGIGGNNPAGAATTASVLAIQPLNKSVTIREVTSPLQGSAIKYGSSFSRAVEVETPDLRRLFISGTASIDQHGRTAHITDIDRQIELTMQVVDAILRSQKMNSNNVTRATAYVKKPEYSGKFVKYLQNCRLAVENWVVSQNDICRDELLVEVELDAIAQL